MRSVSRALLAGGLGLAAASLAACGSSSGLLPADKASTLQTELSSASNDITNGDCVSAARVIEAVQTQVANLPGSVDPVLVSDLGRGAQTVRALAKTQCSGTVSTATNTSTSTTTTPATTHPRTTSTPTSTTTTPTATTTTPTITTPPTTPTTPSTTTPATTTSTPGTTSTGANGGAGLPGSGTGTNGQGNG
ncbi:MAG TPA: hypothetical protein VG275_00675 [Solirubrobacteraceae bacterium]|nr:hypothetical protein [Solirubrobacteraceae bacterium]